MRRAPRFGEEFRLALAVLSGQDVGNGKTAWIDWWREAKKSFLVAEARPPIVKGLRAVWEGYWDEPYLAK